MADDNLNITSNTEEMSITPTLVKETGYVDHSLCRLCRSTQVILFENGDGSQVLCTHEDLFGPDSPLSNSYDTSILESEKLSKASLPEQVTGNPERKKDLNEKDCLLVKKIVYPTQPKERMQMTIPNLLHHQVSLSDSLEITNQHLQKEMHIRKLTSTTLGSSPQLVSCQRIPQKKMPQVMEEIPPQSESPIYFQPQPSKMARCTTLSGLDPVLTSQMSSPSIIKHATKGSSRAHISMVDGTHTTLEESTAKPTEPGLHG